MSESVLNTLIVTVLGAGGATFLWAVARSVIAFRNSAEGREDKAIARLEKFEADCRQQLVMERAWGTYWYHRAGTLERALVIAGAEVPPGPPPPDHSSSSPLG